MDVDEISFHESHLVLTENDWPMCMAWNCRTKDSGNRDYWTHRRYHKLITTQQFGFLSKCSTCTQLLDCLNDWTLSIRNRHDTDIIYFDFAKAFDSVSHAKLVHKLQAYGITGRLLKLLSYFLSNRFQRVVLPNGVSTYLAVTSGVSQGSVLGPICFLFL